MSIRTSNRRQPIYWHAAILSGLAIAPPRAHGEELEFLSSWPFVATKAVASDDSSIPAVAFNASGGGFIALDVSSVAKPHPVSNAAYVRTGGFVFDIDPTPTHVFAAAGKAGLVRVARATFSVDAALPNLGDARVVEAFRVDDREYVLVGTEFGRLSLVRSLTAPGPNGALQIEAETYTAGAVSALAVTLGGAGQDLTILVGTACAGVLRFDIPRSALGHRQAVAPHLLQPSGSWAPTGSHGHVPFVRALEIDDLPTPSTAPSRAFIATHSDGIHAVDLSAGGALVPVVSAGWPIHPGGISFAQGLALDKHDDRLAVANGPSFEGEWNWWGECEFPWTCDGAPAVNPTAPGLRLYENVSTGTPIEVGFLSVSYGIPSLLLTPPVDVAMRKVGPNELRFDIASEYLGFHLARATRDSSQGGMGPWTMGATGGFDSDDDIPIGSMYDVLVRENVAIYTANGPTLAAFPITTNVPFSAPPRVEMPGCVSLAFDATTTPRLFGARKLDGVCVYDVSGANAVDPKFLGLLSTNGRPNSARIAPGLGPAGHPWLLAPNTSTYGLPQPSPGSLFVFDVSATDPAAAVPVAAWIDTELRTYADLAFADVSATERIVWMNYAPHAYGDPSFGIVTLRLARDSQTGITTITKLSRLALDSPGASAKGEPAGRMEYDPITQRLYAAFGCNGVAMFDVNDPSAPTLLGSYIIPARTALTVRVLPWDHQRLAITLIGYGTGEGLGLLDVTSGTSMTQPGSLRVYETPFQCHGLEFPPDAVSSHRMFLADGRGGVHYARLLP